MQKKLRVKDVLLFLRAAYCRQINDADIKEGLASVETSALLPFFLDDAEEYGIRILAFGELRERLIKQQDESSIFEAFLSAINKDSKLSNLESMVHIEVCSTLDARSVNLLLRAKIDSCRNMQVRLKLIKSLLARDPDSDKISNWLTKIALHDSKRDVRLAAAQALAGRSGQTVINALTSLLVHKDKAVKELAKHTLSITNVPRWFEMLFGKLVKEREKKTLKNNQKISELQDILANRIDEWNANHLLACIAEDSSQGTPLKDIALKTFHERVSSSASFSNEKLIAVYHEFRFQEAKDIVTPVFRELQVNRQGEEVYQFFLRLAREDSDHDTYIFALQTIERLGERARLREEIFFLPE